MQPNSETQLLTLEQQFNLRKYQEEIGRVPREQLEELFIEILRQKYAQLNLFQDLMRQGKPF
jgi:hypothetical protein